MADVMGLVIGYLVVGGIGFVIGRYGNTPTQEKLAELQRRIDVLTIENEDLTTSQKNFLFKGLRSGIHTSTQLEKLSAEFVDKYFYKKQSIVYRCRHDPRRLVVDNMIEVKNG